MMKKPRSLLLMIAAGVAFAAPAKAQFISGTSPMDLSVQSRALTSSVINRNAMRATARRSAAPRFNATRRPAVGDPSEALSDALLRRITGLREHLRNVRIESA